MCQCIFLNNSLLYKMKDLSIYYCYQNVWHIHSFEEVWRIMVLEKISFIYISNKIFKWIYFRQHYSFSLYIIITDWSFIFMECTLLIYCLPTSKAFCFIFIQHNEKKRKIFVLIFLLWNNFFGILSAFVLFWHILIFISSMFSFLCFSSLDNFLYLFFACFCTLSLLLSQYSFAGLNGFFLSFLILGTHVFQIFIQ